MPRAQPFLGAEIHERAKVIKSRRAHRLTGARFSALATIGQIPERRRARCRVRINKILRHHDLWRLQDAQEQPARIIAAFKTVQRPAEKLLAAIDQLSIGIRQVELCTGSLETSLKEFLRRVDERSAYWSRYVTPGRPSDANHARKSLYRYLEAIAVEFSPEHLGKQTNERLRRRWCAAVMRAAGLMVPDEKKNRAKITGQRLLRTHAPPCR